MTDSLCTAAFGSLDNLDGAACVVEATSVWDCTGFFPSI
jgi:hypothetical protein